MQQNHFKSLAPANDIKGVESYIEWLDGIVSGENSDTFGNIAMTGDLGIGKSSVVRTFERQKHYKFIYLSASDLGYRFDEKQPDAEAEQKRNEEIQRRLEKDLLVQLIALCRRSDIPKSRFRMVPESESHSSRMIRCLYSALGFFAVLSGGKLIANHFLPDIDLVPNISFVPLQWGILLLFLGITAGCGIYRLLTGYRLSKLSLGNEKNLPASAEIDVSALEPETLDTNLHEILYLFEQLASKEPEIEKEPDRREERKPVFVIEDLDRYPSDICIPILTKLRQINNMLNNRYRNQHGGYGLHYKFIYLLNDRIFDASESGRTLSENDPYKFFDVIIPVLPKLGFTNSADIIRERFGEAIDQKFIEEISCYVYDYRKLTDIENEFSVYQERFKKDENILPTNLLAFVIYKVFYKEKYDQLHKADAKEGAPVSELLKSLLIPDAYPDNKRKIEPLESILEHQFKEKLFDILQITAAVKNKYKSDIVTEDIGTDFDGEDLSGIDLSEKELCRRIFIGANLSAADLTLANVSFSDFSDAILNIADLTHATIEDANLSNAFMLGAKLSFANLSRANLFKAKLYCADLTRAQLIKTNLTSANLNKATLTHANLTDAVLAKASLITAIMKNVDLTAADLSYSNLTDANLTAAELIGAKLIGTNLLGADLTSVILLGAKFCRDPRCKTLFPDGFDPEEHGMIEVDMDGSPVTPLDPEEPAAEPETPDETGDSDNNAPAPEE